MPGCTAKIGPAMQPGEPGERRAEAEHERVEQADVDAERRDHRRGCDAPARISMPRRVRVTTNQSSTRDRQPDGDDHQAVERVAQARQQLDRGPAGSGGSVL